MTDRITKLRIRGLLAIDNLELDLGLADADADARPERSRLAPGTAPSGARSSPADESAQRLRTCARARRDFARTSALAPPLRPASIMRTSTETPTTAAARDLPTVLGAAHARLDALFEDLIAAFRADAREDAARLWTELDAGLRAHFALEEEEILPRLAEVDPQEAAALLAEHERIRRRVTELGVGVDLHATRSDTVEALVRDLRAHAKREDALAYPWAERHLDAATRASISAQALDVAKAFFRDATRMAHRAADRIL